MLKNPDCFRTLNVDTSTGMSIQHIFIKKEIISGQYEKKSTGTFNETSNVTSTKGIAIKK